MTKFSRPRSWVDHRLADGLEIDGRLYTVELVARRGTGASGFRVTVVFMPHDREAAADVEVELGTVATSADVAQRAKDLQGDPGRIVELFRQGRAT